MVSCQWHQSQSPSMRTSCCHFGSISSKMVQEHFHVSSTSITTNMRSVALLHLAGQFTVHEWLVMSAYLVTISLAMDCVE